MQDQEIRTALFLEELERAREYSYEPKPIQLNIMDWAACESHTDTYNTEIAGSMNTREVYLEDSVTKGEFLVDFNIL